MSTQLNGGPRSCLYAEWPDGVRPSEPVPGGVRPRCVQGARLADFAAHAGQRERVAGQRRLPHRAGEEPAAQPHLLGGAEGAELGFVARRQEVDDPLERCRGDGGDRRALPAEQVEVARPEAFARAVALRVEARGLVHQVAGHDLDRHEVVDAVAVGGASLAIGRTAVPVQVGERAEALRAAASAKRLRSSSRRGTANSRSPFLSTTSCLLTKRQPGRSSKTTCTDQSPATKRFAARTGPGC